jgi:hypothetical protein
MSRTISEIYDSLNTVKNNMTELKGFVTETTGTDMDNANNLALDASSGSKVAKWRLWLWIVAVASWVIENIVSSGELTISAIVNGNRPHTLRWYEDQTRAWQYGHELAWLNDDHWGYATEDTAAKLAAAVSATETGNGQVTIKVVKEVTGTLTPLSGLEQDSLDAYWARWKDAGVEILLVTTEPDQIKFNATVVRNRLILASDGTLLRDSSVDPLTAALADYMDAVPFNGVIRVTDIEQAAKSAEGIIDFVISSMSISPDGETWTVVTREVIPDSGFANISYDDCTLTYIDE